MAVATQVAIHVVHGDEEDVELFGRVGGGGGGGGENDESQQQESSHGDSS
jgi:hypothetical protein